MRWSWLDLSSETPHAKVVFTVCVFIVAFFLLTKPKERARMLGPIKSEHWSSILTFALIIIGFIGFTSIMGWNLNPPVTQTLQKVVLVEGMTNDDSEDKSDSKSNKDTDSEDESNSDNADIKMPKTDQDLESDSDSDAGQVKPTKAKTIKEMDKECKVLKGNPLKPYCSAWVCNDNMNVMHGHKDMDVCKKYGGVLLQWSVDKKSKKGDWVIHHNAKHSEK